jgi:hypothetical protein
VIKKMEQENGEGDNKDGEEGRTEDGGGGKIEEEH